MWSPSMALQNWTTSGQSVPPQGSLLDIEINLCFITSRRLRLRDGRGVERLDDLAGEDYIWVFVQRKAARTKGGIPRNTW